MLAAYSFGDLMWTFFVFFAWIIFSGFSSSSSATCLAGTNQRLGENGLGDPRDLLPYLGIFIYLIANGKSMGERARQRAQAQPSHAYIA